MSSLVPAVLLSAIDWVAVPLAAAGSVAMLVVLVLAAAAVLLFSIERTDQSAAEKLRRDLRLNPAHGSTRQFALAADYTQAREHWEAQLEELASRLAADYVGNLRGHGKHTRITVFERPKNSPHVEVRDYLRTAQQDAAAADAALTNAHKSSVLTTPLEPMQDPLAQDLALLRAQSIAALAAAHQRELALEDDDE